MIKFFYLHLIEGFNGVILPKHFTDNCQLHRGRLVIYVIIMGFM